MSELEAHPKCWIKKFKMSLSAQGDAEGDFSDI